MYKEQFEKMVCFMKKYQHLIDCHLTDFLTENVWENCLPDSLKFELGNSETSDMNQNAYNILQNHTGHELNTFLQEINSLNLEFLSNIISTSEVESINYNDDCTKDIKNDFMKKKKSYEVDIFTKVVANLIKSCSSNVIIDAGAGKGYSSFNLADYYHIPVLAVESSKKNHHGALLRQDLLKQKTGRSSSMVQYVAEHIDDSTNYVRLVQEHFSDYSDHFALTGLHACGSLTDSVIKAFVKSDQINCLCIVPCCYHLATQSLASEYNFSKNARMLAQQSVQRISQKTEPLSPSLFYRAVLQVILKSLGIEDMRIGRGAPIQDFATYATWALTKLNLSQIPSAEVLDETYRKYESYKWKFQVFQLLRIQMAPVVEAAITLDRVLYLNQSIQCDKLKIMQLFDPVLSPRSWAIIAVKGEQRDRSVHNNTN